MAPVQPETDRKSMPPCAVEGGTLAFDVDALAFDVEALAFDVDDVSIKLPSDIKYITFV